MSLLKPHKIMNIPRKRQIPSSLIEVNNNQKYKVEEILGLK